MNKVSLLLNLNTLLSKESVESLLEEEIKKIISNSQLFCESFRIDFSVAEPGRVRVFEIPPQKILKNLSREKKVFPFNGKNYEVKMNSQRYFMFKENPDCVCCGLKGTRMFLEYHPYDMTPHFNLYGEENCELILMTKDHITARALGGEDRHSNYQTMCSVCNNLKGHAFLTLDSLKILRNLYDKKKSSMTKKQIHCFIEDSKKRLPKKEKKPKQKTCKDCFRLNCDLACYSDSKGSIYGVHVYENSNDRRIGSMKKGTILEPILEYRNEFICILNERQSIRISKYNLLPT
jgi:hypothetical protein